MSRRALLIDAVVAVLVAILVLILTPGLAISGVIGLLVLLICGVSVVVERRRRRPGRRRKGSDSIVHRQPH